MTRPRLTVAQAKFGRMLQRQGLAFDTNRGLNPVMVLQPAPGQRDWPAALKRLSSLPETPVLAPSSTPRSRPEEIQI